MYRVGFEEIHKIWSDISYRPVFQFIHRISTVHVPVFGTSGTLPEHLLDTLPELTSTVWKTIRMPSNRKELVYEIRRLPREQRLQEAIVEYWQRIHSSYREEDRCLVFCRTIAQCKSLATLLGVDPYHRDCQDDSAVQKFKQGTQKILPTTVKLGCGFHYSHIRDVIHMDIAYSMVDQLQEDSRGGRDGLPCNAITFVSEGFPSFKDTKEYDLRATAVYQWAKETERCLRIAPSLFLDGVPVTCCLIGAQLCANCTNQLVKPPPSLARSLPIPKALPVPAQGISKPKTLKRPMDYETPLVTKRLRKEASTPSSIGYR